VALHGWLLSQAEINFGNSWGLEKLQVLGKGARGAKGAQLAAPRSLQHQGLFGDVITNLVFERCAFAADGRLVIDPSCDQKPQC
jgi:hypothetical protein